MLNINKIYYINLDKNCNRNYLMVKQLKDSKYLLYKNMYKIHTGFPIFEGAHCYLINISTAKLILDKINDISIYIDYDQWLFDNFNCYTYITNNLSLVRFKSDRDPEAVWNHNRKQG